MKVKRRWSSNGTAAFGEGERRLMISSSEVGGCCRVQVARLFPSVALSSFSSRSSSSSFSSSRFLLPPFRASPLAQGCFPPSLSLSLSFASTLFVLSRPFYLQKFKPHHHYRSYARTTKLARLFSLPSLVAPRNVSIIYGTAEHKRRFESFYFGRNFISDRDFFEYSSGGNIYPAPAGFLCDTFFKIYSDKSIVAQVSRIFFF